MITEVFMLSSNCFEMIIQGVLGLHEFWAREKLVQAKFVLVKLCTSSFVKLRGSEILSTCYLRNGIFLKFHASKIRTSKIRVNQRPHVCKVPKDFRSSML